MFGTHVTGEVLVSGHAAAHRMVECVLPGLPGKLRVKEAHWTNRLIRQLRRGKQPLCVMEEYVSLRDPMPELKRILGRNARAAAASRNLWFTEFTCALNLLPELAEASPETRFIITCHSRCGVTKKDRAAYERRPEVLKVIGFVNSDRNTQFLLKTMQRIYFD